MSLRHASLIEHSTDTSLLTLSAPTFAMLPSSGLMQGFAPPGTPNVLFDSTVNANDAGADTLFPNDNLFASFSTGGTPITLGLLQFLLDDPSPGDGGTIDVTLWSDLGGAPDIQIDDLGNIPDASLSPGGSLISLTVNDGLVLAAGTRYWIEMTSNSFATSSEWDLASGNAGTGVSSEFIDAYGNVFVNGGGAGTLIMQINDQGTCYAAGTHILTDRGEVPVQDLRPGDQVVTARTGGTAPVRWIGHRHVDLRRHRTPAGMNPVRIRADAFAPGVPHRDLIMSPDHAVFLDGALISVRHLLNGATIVQEAWNEITYYHIELDQHDVLLAEGLAAESFLDVGNRDFFANGPNPARLAAALDPAVAASIWDAQACAPTLSDPAALHQTLLQRAVARGYTTTEDPDLHLLAGGRVLRPERVAGAWHFSLPPHTKHATLCSRTVVASQMHPGTDGRRLGVGVTALALDDCQVALGDRRLAAGWHDAEPSLRWTQGAATIQTRGARSMIVRLHAGLQYWGDMPTVSVAQAA
jgi:hypothetical protein